MINKLALLAGLSMCLAASSTSAAPRYLEDGGPNAEQSYGGARGHGYEPAEGQARGSRPAYSAEINRADGEREDYAHQGGRATQMASAHSDEDLSLGREAPQSSRTLVPDPTGEAPGVITVDTANRYLYLSLPSGQAVRYDIGVGRQGFEWSGVARVGRKAEWPGWTPPPAMLKRRPDLPSHMAGGIENPLGARALYLYSGNRDTMFRIHGSNEPWTIGEAVSSGCIRMLNDDVIDLYEHVKIGATVKVLS